MQQDRDWSEVRETVGGMPDIRILKRQHDPKANNVVFSEAQMARTNVNNFYDGSWAEGSETSVAPASAVAWYFAREIHQQTGVAVGIIDNAVGGTSMEAYMPRRALTTETLFPLMDDWMNAGIAPEWHRERAKKNLSANTSAVVPHHPYEPTFLYNAEVVDMIDFGFRGVLWYQGETNATDITNRVAWDIDHNQALFEGLINSWRSEAGRDFPFYYVQLPNLNRNWAPFRDMQRRVLTDSGIENLGMAVILDQGNSTDVHPNNKVEVGKRLSLIARNQLYGEPDLVYSGPIFNGDFEVSGSSVIVGFDHTGDGLTTDDCLDITGFEVAGSDGRWYPAKALISRDDFSRLIVSSDQVSAPQSVRYAWADNPDFNLYSYYAGYAGEEYQLLPASPFRAGDLSFD